MLRMSLIVAALTAAFGVIAGPAVASAVPFETCTQARDAGHEDIPSTSEYYGEHLDRDGDGIACESS